MVIILLKLLLLKSIILTFAPETATPLSNLNFAIFPLFLCYFLFARVLCSFLYHLYYFVPFWPYSRLFFVLEPTSISERTPPGPTATKCRVPMAVRTFDPLAKNTFIGKIPRWNYYPSIFRSTSSTQLAPALSPVTT